MTISLIPNVDKFWQQTILKFTDTNTDDKETPWNTMHILELNYTYSSLILNISKETAPSDCCCQPRHNFKKKETRGYPGRAEMLIKTLFLEVSCWLCV